MQETKRPHRIRAFKLLPYQFRLQETLNLRRVVPSQREVLVFFNEGRGLTRHEILSEDFQEF
jgi:hypothetical protein